ncbi:MAG: MFS transporter, partial [Nanoarchaeota archaeon]|nr:MFS transporter [Nanoarchaeota archaeon]
MVSTVLVMKNNLKKFYYFSFVSVFILYVPFIIYYFQSLDLGLGKIAILVSTTSVVRLIFEIPSGYVADRIGRKNSMLIGAIFQLIGMGVLFYASSFSIIFIAHIVLGLGFAFLSGADSAFLYDTLLVLKREKDYKKVEGKARFFGGVSGVIAGVAGSLVVTLSIRHTILFSIFVQFISILVVLSFTEPSRHKLIEKLPFKEELFKFKNIIIKSLHNKKLLGLFVYAFIVMGVADTIWINYQPYFRAINLPVVWFGILFAAFSVMTAISALKADYIERKFGVSGSLLLMPLLLIGALLFAGMFFVWFGLFFFLLREVVRGMSFPVLNDYANKIAASHERATVLSVQSVFGQLGFVVIALLFGFLGDAFGLRSMYLVLGLVLL